MRRAVRALSRWFRRMLPVVVGTLGVVSPPVFAQGAGRARVLIVSGVGGEPRVEGDVVAVGEVVGVVEVGGVVVDHRVGRC